MKVTERNILDEIQKCKENIKYYYQKYYAPAIEEGAVIKSHADNQLILKELADKAMNQSPDSDDQSKN